ncbi:FadR family transcriptional regulator [Pantoea sp. Tr-811]|uniref:FadR/GntR family transcriptional regulator n=1 Tax=Pantoea sp. Tr-811 TaxID=2608361 RepID=UPI001423A5EF|nr:FCD domain-containing protein [Pantoea sp. Tr-811]NIF30306.1 FadR family transcriptional regulator [Pantoea sp. Tr-811]
MYAVIGLTVQLRKETLTEAITQVLYDRLDSGFYLPQTKLPSELELSKELSVSRTVIREATASLRLSGRLYARQGVGVFVVDRVRPLSIDGLYLPCADDSNSMRALEVRIGVETESAALAALRRNTSSLSKIVEAYDLFSAQKGQCLIEESKADFGFHMAIAEASGNFHVVRCLEAYGYSHILEVKRRRGFSQGVKTDNVTICREHGAILSAICRGDATEARTAMYKHLHQSLERLSASLRD